MSKNHFIRRLGRLGRAIKRLYAHPRVLFFRCEQFTANSDSVLSLRFPSPEETDAIAQNFPYLKQTLPLYAARFAQGDRLCLAYAGAHLAHACWWGKRNAIAADYELGEGRLWPLNAPAAVIYDCWTPDNMRGHGYYPDVIRQLTNSLLQDYPEAWIYCLADNHASRRGIEKAGFNFQGELDRIRIFGKFL